jgi:stage II sporulation protein D
MEDDLCAARPGWTVAIPLPRLQHILNGDPRTAVHGDLRSITVARRDRAGRAEFVSLVGDQTRTVRGGDLRAAIMRDLGPGSLRSTLFTVAIRDMTATFTGRGSGHGVGLCQAGARSRVARGDPPGVVLAHYYPGTRLAPWR